MEGTEGTLSYKPLGERPTGTEASRMLLTAMLGGDSLPLLCGCMCSKYLLLPSPCVVALLEGAHRGGRLRKSAVSELVPNSPKFVGRYSVYFAPSRIEPDELRASANEAVELLRSVAEVVSSIPRESLRTVFEWLRDEMPLAARDYYYYRMTLVALGLETLGGVAALADMVDNSPAPELVPREYSLGFRVVEPIVTEALYKALDDGSLENTITLLHIGLSVVHGLLDAYYTQRAEVLLDMILGAQRAFAMKCGRTVDESTQYHLGMLASEHRKLRSRCHLQQCRSGIGAGWSRLRDRTTFA